MCEPASFVITKKSVYWSENSDNHHLIIEGNKLKEQNERGEYLFVRVEIVPPNRDYRLPFSKWVFKTDQDLLPPWYDPKDAEARCRKHLKDWRKANIVMPSQTIDKLNKYCAKIYGTVKCNFGTVEDNCGTVKCNPGTVKDNSGTVKDNFGTVKDNSGTVEDNFGTVEDNSGTVETHKPQSSICNNKKSGVLIDRSGAVPKNSPKE